ncbi:Zinc finger protein zpr1 [Dictyocoela muelleri]|nr:Zinc finger protein zpr1 [Dictyocoela muelleri]
MTDITSRFEEHKTKCSTCKKDATLRILYITPPNEPTQVLTSIYCDHCNQNSTGIELLQEKHPNGAIKITAHIETPEDLGRYVSMTKMSTLKIFDEDGSVFYEYQSIDNIHCVVESVLLKAIDEIVQYYRLDCDNELISNIKDNLPIFDNEISRLKEDNPEDKVKIQVYKTIQKIIYLIKNSNFKMEIYDETGYSRISKINKKLADLDIDDLNAFNDDRVNHQWVK